MTANEQLDVLQAVLGELALPARRWQIVMQAEDYGAVPQLRDLLRALPDQPYHCLEQVAEFLAGQPLLEARGTRAPRPHRHHLAPTTRWPIPDPRSDPGTACHRPPRSPDRPVVRRSTRASGQSTSYAVRDDDQVHYVSALSADGALRRLRRDYSGPVHVRFLYEERDTESHVGGAHHGDPMANT